MSPKQTDVGARLAELEATVRGLTQELVDANERIRQLEAVLDEEPAAAVGADGGTETPTLGDRARDGDGGRNDAEGTRAMGDDGQAEEETGSDLDDIIVA